MGVVFIQSISGHLGVVYFWVCHIIDGWIPVFVCKPIFIYFLDIPIMPSKSLLLIVESCWLDNVFGVGWIIMILSL